MNLTVLFIAAFLPLIPVMAAALRSGAFGRGSVGMLFRLFFLGVLAAVPAFLMEAGGMLAVTAALRVFTKGEGSAALGALLRYVLAAALVEEGWKHFVLRSSTWGKMTMETVADGIAASVVVGAGFSAVLYAAWQLSYLAVPAEMGSLRAAMPEYLVAGAVTSFLYALLFIPAHFGWSGLMGALYGAAMGQEQKKHGARAGFLLFVSFLLPVTAHGAFAASIGFGIGRGEPLWTALGFAGQALSAMVVGMAMNAAREDMLAGFGGAKDAGGKDERDVDFADSEEFAAFAEGAGAADDGRAPTRPRISLDDDDSPPAHGAAEGEGGLYEAARLPAASGLPAPTADLKYALRGPGHKETAAPECGAAEREDGSD